MKRMLPIVFIIMVSFLVFGVNLVLSQEEEPKIPINCATQEELQKLPGITPELAEAIIKGRPYANVEALLTIEGIGEEEIAKIAELIEIDKLFINFATVEDLLTLPGITKEVAEAIRKRCIPCLSTEDLLTIEGIGEEELAKFQEHIDFSLEKPRDTRGRTTTSRSPAAVATPLGTTNP